MISFKTKKPDITFTLAGGGRITLDMPKSKVEMISELKEDKDYLVEIKEYKEKRSLDANSYCWVLIGKLAAKLNTTPTEIYKKAIREIGDNYEIVCVQDVALDKLIEGWQHNGIGWQTEKFNSKVSGCTNVILYYGSSTYDTKQMSRLISNIVESCKEVGIDTMTPNELNKLIERW